MKHFATVASLALLVFVATPVLAQQTNSTPAPSAAPAQPPLAVQSIPGDGARAPATPEMKAARQAMRASCATDMTTLCADVPAPTDESPPARARMQCLRTHAAQLSLPCRQALVALRDARKAAKS